MVLIFLAVISFSVIKLSVAIFALSLPHYVCVSREPVYYVSELNGQYTDHDHVLSIWIA